MERHAGKKIVNPQWKPFELSSRDLWHGGPPLESLDFDAGCSHTGPATGMGTENNANS
jgi:hypothetical protein